MSKINAIRLINLNYNYNGIHVDDETFYLDGESTLFSLRNGGGKSVLVQMLIAPFVHKRYRNNNDRQFSSYFTTNKPTFILVEWKLDGNSGYVLTGMMVRKSQEIKEDQSQNDLDILQFIHEYKEQNQYTIHNIPFINTIDDNKRLMKYSDCKGLLESIKIDKEYKFFLYDMNNPNSSRNYFAKLEEYQIYHKEWESIVKKINLKESGLSELFTNAKDEAGLIETWFLPTVEDKLNKGKNRIEEFRDILGKYIKQYKDNKSKIDQKKIIFEFKEETSEVLNIVQTLKSTTEEKKGLENRIANLIIKLKEIRDFLESEKINLEDKESFINYEIRRIEYEEISFEIYKLEDESLSLANELSQVIELIKKKEEDSKVLESKKNIQLCAKLYKHYHEASKDVQELENKLELKKEEDKDRTPEREALGYTLRNHYEKFKQKMETQINNLEIEINHFMDKSKSLEHELDILDKEEKENISKLSAINTNINNYDKSEIKFNNEYKENLRRNILNEYEDGSLDIRLENLRDIIRETGLELARLREGSIDNNENLKQYKRQIQEKEKLNGAISQEIKGIEDEIRKLDEEIEERKSILKHIGFSDNRVFDQEEILMEFQRRKSEIQEVIRSLEINLRDLKLEYNKLKSGKVLELPEDIKEALDVEDINYVYGMEWLKRNNKSLDKNRMLVKSNPFIPYGLVLTQRDVERLKEKNLGIYTSFPIPIVVRESLEDDLQDEMTSIYSGGKVNFYVLFNKNLLDEEELERILQKKEEEILSLESTIQIRNEDHNLYDSKYNIIKFQNLSEKGYKQIKNDLNSKLKIMEELENHLNTLRDEEHNLLNTQDQLNRTIQKNDKGLEKLKLKEKELSDLNKEYTQYLNFREERKAIEKSITRIKAETKLKKDENNKLKDDCDKSRDSRREYISKLESIKVKLQEYLRYEKRDLIQKDIEDVKARYIALTSEIASELKELEESYSKARTRFNEQEKDLIYQSNRFSVKQEDYENEIYDNFILETIENNISDIASEMKVLNEKSSNLNAKKSVKEREITLGYNKLKENLDTIELLPRNEIVLTEFKKRINERKDELKKLKGDFAKIINKIGNFDNNLSSLAEYSDLTVVESITFDEDFISMNREALDRFKGMLLRDYRQIDETINEYRNELKSSLDKILRNKAFEDDFFNKPLNTLYSLIKEPDEFIEQLSTTIRAYDDLMAKLEVDIAIIEKEKQRVVELFLEYISDIHKNLNKIDKNSTIKIREKPIKMLRMELTDWETEENQYKNRLRDMIEELTQSGINRLENNENIEEIISPAITTKNLYNTVVGINNISIKLYKIEAERQYQIDWSEVSKNSGGEGFLSAFVILSSLLSFMRRDETDIFAELEEGKVLIMDNPFAQTNSSHLLKPLMDVAKKSNTQLICFTGLGGESIYNSFDNIYVLNLISSNLKKGMQYLKSEHTKGEEIEVMETAQVRTEDVIQESFLF